MSSDTCPIDGGTFTTLESSEAAARVMGAFLSSKSPLVNMIRGAARGQTSGVVKECNECGFLATFTKKK